MWILALLAVQIGLLNGAIGDSVRIVRNERAMSRGEALARAGVEIAVANLAAREPRDRWGADGSLRIIDFAGAALAIRVTDESGRIDINRADQALLAALLRRLTGSPTTAERLAERLMEHREPERSRRRQGTGNTNQDAAGGRALTRAVLHPAELGHILDITPALLASIEALTTVHGEDGRINPVTAADELILALPNVDARDLAKAVEVRRMRGATSPEFQTLVAPAQPWLAARTGPVFRVSVEVTGRGQPAIGRAEAVVLLGQDTAAPYRVLHWR